MHIHQDLVSNYHWWQVMANAMAGGVCGSNATGASNTFGGFNCTATANANYICTWATDYSGTPLVMAAPQGAASSDTALRVVPYGIAGSSAGFRLLNATNATVTTGYINVMIFGKATGTRHS